MNLKICACTRILTFLLVTVFVSSIFITTGVLGSDARILGSAIDNPVPLGDDIDNPVPL